MESRAPRARYAEGRANSYRLKLILCTVYEHSSKLNESYPDELVPGSRALATLRAYKTLTGYCEYIRI